MKKLIAILTIVGIILSSTAVYAAPVEYGAEYANQPGTLLVQKFTDVPTNHWAYEYIMEMVNKGVVSGYPDGMFRPDRQVSRAEFAKLISVASGLPVRNTDKSSFYDVNVDDWYAPYIESAKDLLTGYNIGGKAIYNPETAAIREDIAIAMVKMKGYDVSVADLSLIQAMFTDYEGISSYAKKYVAVAVERGLISGYEDQTFRSQNSITRAEVATMLWRASKYGNDNKIDATKTEDLITEVTTPVKEDKPEEVVKVEEPEIEEQEEIVEEEVEEVKPYTIDTIAEVSDKVSSMVVDKSNVIHYVVDDVVYSSDGDELDPGLLVYDIGYDDKNYDYSLSLIHLGYDEYNNILYLAANDAYKRLIIFDITDYGNPKVIMNRHNTPEIEEKSVMIDYPYGDSIRTRINVLKNGALTLGSIDSDIVRVNENSSHNFKLMANPNTLALSKYEDTYTFPSSVEGMLASNKLDGKMYLKNNNLYFWMNDEGLVKIDKKGYRDILATSDDIESLDYKPVDGFNIWNCLVDNDGSFIFYDNSYMSIRIIKNTK